MTTKNHNIFFLGCGKMGTIILQNLIDESGFNPSQIKVLKQNKKDEISGVEYFYKSQNLPQNYQADLVFLAIKPQDAKTILSEFSKSKIFTKNTIFISILAGKKIAFFENIFGKDKKIIRTMPNLPIQYGQGVMPYLFNKNVNIKEAKIVQNIFNNFGSSFAIKNEKLFDVITAIFGSGPAYIFLLQEVIANIATKKGIDKKEVNNLVKKLFLGSSLISEFSNENFTKLQQAVTSKNGTTEAGLKVLKEKSALSKIFTKTIDAAIKRSQELSK